MVSVGVEGLSGSEADIESQSNWALLLTPGFRVECIITELRSTGKQEDAINGNTDNLVRVGKLQKRYSFSSSCSKIPLVGSSWGGGCYTGRENTLTVPDVEIDV